MVYFRIFCLRNFPPQGLFEQYCFLYTCDKLFASSKNHRLALTGPAAWVIQYDNSKEKCEIALMVNKLKNFVKIKPVPATGLVTASCTWIATDPFDLEADVIALIFKHRWAIEIFFRFFKHVLGCRHLMSNCRNGIELQTYAARICAINIVRIIMLQAAAAGRVDVMRVGFVGAVRAIIAFAPVLAVRPVWQLPMIYEAMLKEIASHLVPERPGRLEPRKVTHDKRGYPKLKTTREQWKKQYAA